MRFARYLSMWQHSRQKARCLGDTSPTPASVPPRCAPPGTRRSTRRRKATGSALQSRCIVSATTTTHAAPSTPVDAPTVTRGKEPTAAIILDAADATTAARTKARALACQALRPSAVTSSMRHSHQGIDHLPTSLSIPGRQTPDFGLKTIGLRVKPVVRIMTTSLSATFHCSSPIRHVWLEYLPSDAI